MAQPQPLFAPLELHTSRLRLRPWRLHDLPEFHLLWSDPDVIFWQPTRSLDESRSQFSRLLSLEHDGLAAFRVSTGEDDGFVGNALLRRAPYEDGLEVGWHLMRKCWRRGYATEAAHAVCDYAFRSLGVPQLTAIVLPDNRRSSAVADRLGMQQDGLIEHEGLLHDRYVLYPSLLRA